MKTQTLACFFAHHNSQNIISDYVYEYIAALQRLNFRVFFISNSLIKDTHQKKLLSIASNCIIYERENKGNDFGAWSWAIQQNILSDDIEYLLLANDSVFGPLYDLELIWNKMMSKGIDFWGLTDTYQGAWHIQSYFICFSKEVFTSEAFHSVFNQNFNSKSKLQIIEKGEILLTQNLIKAGFKGEVYIEYAKLDNEIDPLFAYNPTHFFWDVLIKKFGFPFVKKDLIFKNPDNLQSLENLFPLIQQESSYSLENIKSAIVEVNYYENRTEGIAPISVLCHIYYPHSVYYFLSRLAILKKYPVRFFFNLAHTVAGDTDFIEILERIFSDAVIIQTPDKGRDIGGKLAALDILLKIETQSLYTLVIHDKFSPHTPTGKQWREQLFKIVDIDIIDHIIGLFENNSKIGVVASKNFLKNEYNPDINGFNCTSSSILSGLIEKYNLRLSNFNFVAGTIFWIKTEILREFFLRNPPLTVRMDLEEGNAIDFTKGTYIHSWERLLTMIPNDQYYNLKGI